MSLQPRWHRCSPLWLSCALVAPFSAGATDGLAPPPSQHPVPIGQRAEPTLQGVTVYRAADLLAHARAQAQATGMAAATDPVRLAEWMEARYREDGYPLAEVQWHAGSRPESGHWVVQEGQLDSIVVQGGEAAVTRRVEGLLAPLLQARPLRQAELERQLTLADDLAEVLLSSRLEPSPDGPYHRLVVTLVQSQRRGSVVLDFVPMRPGHAKRLAVQEERYGLLRAGDMARVLGIATREAQGGESVFGHVYYRTPVGDRGDYVEGILGNARANQTLSNTGGQTELRGLNASLAWGYPYLRDLHRFGYVIGVLDHAESRNQAVAVQSSRSEASALRLYHVRGQTSAQGTLYQSALVLSRGQRPEGARAALPDGEAQFSHLRAGLGAAGPWSLGEGTVSWRFESALQWTSQALPWVEKMMLGHYPYLRGYAPAEVSGDRGAAFTLELTRRSADNQTLVRVAPFAFVSAGRVASLAQAQVQAPSWGLASAGVGLRFPLLDRLGVETWAAVPLRDGPLSSRGRPAFYLSVGTSW